MADDASGSGEGSPPDPIADQVARHINAAMPLMFEQFMKRMNDERNKDKGPENQDEGGNPGGGNPGDGNPGGENPGGDDQENRNNRNKGCTYKTFSYCKPPEFTGEEGAVSLLNWIDNIDSVLETCECEPEKQVRYIKSLFRKKALTWWKLLTGKRGKEAALAM